MTDTEQDSGRALRVDEVADRLSVHPETVRRWLRDGRLRGFRFGPRKGGWRVSERALAAYVRELEGMTEASPLPPGGCVIGWPEESQ
jgi:excisionase family DNA binding protein